MKKKSILLLTIIFLFSINSFGQKAKQTKPKAKQNVQSGLLYKISGKNLKKPSYLFGTIHILCEKDIFDIKKLATYLDQTERLILELDISNPEILQKVATSFNLPEEKTLRDYLSAEKYEKVDAMFKQVLGVQVESLGNFNPLILSALISTSEKSIGCKDSISYELVFAGIAKEWKMQIESLETIEEQSKALQSTPIEKQAEDLYKMSLDIPKMLAQFKELLAIYNQQDSEKLYELLIKQAADSETSMEEFLDNRNLTWIPRIEKLIAEKPSFIAVGGGHLGGKKGVVSLLREKGYTVTAIKL